MTQALGFKRFHKCICNKQSWEYILGIVSFTVSTHTLPELANTYMLVCMNIHAWEVGRGGHIGCCCSPTQVLNFNYLQIFLSHTHAHSLSSSMAPYSRSETGKKNNAALFVCNLK